MSPRDTDDGERPTSGTDGHVPVEVSVGADTDEQPPVESNTRIDIIVDRESYPTARLDDGRYVAWWFTTDAPEPDAAVTSEWVTAPTRFLAAGTLHELWENPAAFDSLTAQG
ncbi:hypothetical protein GJ631_13790 [Natronomonas sp. CBA1123]|uniref:hypothetical protein n=1 Tax=Natronomonas sp. CBA1123 TaxID=2668070 RepID=UPI0012E9B9F8|nr:hypothetical protein [Natronomonas sp. CBA1123]MUV87603.1 hypothetical protein [Natronomonas sp. CBA1123]